MIPVNVEAVEHRELINKSGDEKYSLSALLTDPFRFKDIVVHHEVLEPGRRSSRSHSHTHREEMIFVIEGSPTGYLKGQKINLRPGDVLGFPPGAENFHHVANETEARVRLLVIASNPKEDQVLYEELTSTHWT